MKLSEIITALWVLSCSAASFAEDAPMPYAADFAAIPADVQAVFKSAITQQLMNAKSQSKLRDMLNERREHKSLSAYLARLVATAFEHAGKKDSTEDPWAAAIVIWASPPDLVIDAILPQLNSEAGQESILERGDQDLRKHLEYEVVFGRPSIDGYLSYLHGHSFDDARGVICYLLRRFPDKSFPGLLEVSPLGMPDRVQLLSRHYQLWATVTRAEAKQDQAISLSQETVDALKYMGSHEAWWVRLYAGGMMKRYVRLRVPEVAALLAHDSEKAVRESVAFEKEAYK